VERENVSVVVYNDAVDREKHWCRYDPGHGNISSA